VTIDVLTRPKPPRRVPARRVMMIASRVPPQPVGRIAYAVFQPVGGGPWRGRRGGGTHAGDTDETRHVVKAGDVRDVRNP